jgi:hypothetical protein
MGVGSKVHGYCARLFQSSAKVKSMPIVGASPPLLSSRAEFYYTLWYDTATDI